MITGIDIVQQQIRIAAGEKLPFRQRDIQFKGHAIECRNQRRASVQIHPVARPHHLVPCPRRPGIRVDSHVYNNYFVPPHYDSMIGKIIAYGDTREQAMARMRTALSEMWVEGIETNIALHRELLQDAAFMRGGHQHSLLGRTPRRTHQGQIIPTPFLR